MCITHTLTHTGKSEVSHSLLNSYSILIKAFKVVQICCAENPSSLTNFMLIYGLISLRSMALESEIRMSLE